MKKRSEEAKWSFLKISATAVEEKGEDEIAVSGARQIFLVDKGIIEQRGLSRAWFPLDPKNFLIESFPFFKCLVFK